jgi:hypothetical protein
VVEPNGVQRRDAVFGFNDFMFPTKRDAQQAADSRMVVNDQDDGHGGESFPVKSLIFGEHL